MPSISVAITAIAVPKGTTVATGLIDHRTRHRFGREPMEPSNRTPRHAPDRHAPIGNPACRVATQGAGNGYRRGPRNLLE